MNKYFGYSICINLTNACSEEHIFVIKTIFTSGIVNEIYLEKLAERRDNVYN